jgi:hypothetical protein
MMHSIRMDIHLVNMAAVAYISQTPDGGLLLTMLGSAGTFTIAPQVKADFIVAFEKLYPHLKGSLS